MFHVISASTWTTLSAHVGSQNPGFPLNNEFSLSDKLTTNEKFPTILVSDSDGDRNFIHPNFLMTKTLSKSKKDNIQTWCQ